MNYQLRRQPNGSVALYRTDLGETMHPQLGPWEEAQRVYVLGTDLPGLLEARKGRGGASDIVVFDVGLGGAANAIAAIQAAQELARHGRPVLPLRIVSFGGLQGRNSRLSMEPTSSHFNLITTPCLP